MLYNHHNQIIALLLSILFVNLASYFSIFQLEHKFEADESFDIYNPNALRELQGKYYMNSDKYKKELQWASGGEDNIKFYSKVKLEAFCAAKERIGEVDDGGKYVCNPRSVRRYNCTLLSLGLNNQITYDQHISNVTGGHCIILGADKDPQNEKTQDSYSRINGQLFVGMIPSELTISSMMKDAKRRDVDIMKIDIEGGEADGLEPFIKDYSVCQILIEVHGTPAEHLQMLQKMAKYSFRIFNVDPNPYCFNCCEYSLINERCMKQYGVIPLAITVPIAEY